MSLFINFSLWPQARWKILREKQHFVRITNSNTHIKLEFFLSVFQTFLYVGGLSLFKFGLKKTKNFTEKWAALLCGSYHTFCFLLWTYGLRVCMYFLWKEKIFLLQIFLSTSWMLILLSIFFSDFFSFAFSNFFQQNANVFSNVSLQNFPLEFFSNFIFFLIISAGLSIP